MANTLGSFLAGVEQGTRTGLDMYKTVQGEARQKRQDQYQMDRDVASDDRYATAFQYQQERDTVGDARAAATAARLAEYQNSRLKLDTARAEDASKRGWAAVQNSANSNRLKGEANQLKRGQQGNTLYKQYVGEIASSLQNPKGGIANTMDLLNSSVTHRAAAVRKVQESGYDIPDEVAAVMQLITSKDGKNVAIAVPGPDGKLIPYDPDGEGEQQAIVIPGSTFATWFGGQDTQDAMGAHGAQNAALATAGAQAQAAFQTGEAGVVAGTTAAAEGNAAITAQLAQLDAEHKSKTKTWTDYRGVTLSSGTNQGQRKTYQDQRAGLEAKLSANEQILKSAPGSLEQLAYEKRQTLGDAGVAVQSVRNNTPIGDQQAAFTNLRGDMYANPGDTRGTAGMSATDIQTQRGNSAKDSAAQVDGIFAKARSGTDSEILTANSAAQSSSMLATLNLYGGADKVLATPGGQALVRNIASQMVKENVEFGSGFLWKIAASQQGGAALDAGLAALQSDVVMALNVEDREPIAMLAAEKLGTKGAGNDPEAALQMAIEGYNKGERPKTGNPQSLSSGMSR